MDVRAFFKKFGAYLAALLLFTGAAITYCFPETEGKVIRSADNINARCAADESYRYKQETGKTTWWNGSMFCGMPNYQINGGQYKADRWMSPLKKVLQHGHQSPIWALLLYFLCFYILMLSFGVSPWLGIAGAFALTLSTYFITIIGAGHDTKASTIALMSVVLAGFRFIFRKKYLLGVLLSMVFMAVGCTAHPQMTYYIFLLAGVLWIGELWDHIREKRVRDLLVGTALFAGAILIGAGANSSNVFANAEYTAETIRGSSGELNQDGESHAGVTEDYATVWSYGKMESFSFLIPGILGGSSVARFGKDSDLYKTLVRNKTDRKTAERFCANVPLYWGDQPYTAGNVYAGAIVCFLFLLGILIVKGSLKWALVAATCFSFALALGDNIGWLTRFFLHYFPLYGKFRAISSILIVAEITMPVLGFLAVKTLLEGKLPPQKVSRAILVSACITVGICLVFALLSQSLNVTGKGDANLKKSFDWVYEAVLKERRMLILRDSLRSAGLILAAALPLWLTAKGKLKAGWMIAALGVLVVLDLWPVNKRYFNDDFFVRKEKDESAFEMQPYEKKLLQDKSFFRVLNLAADTYHEARTSYRLQSVGGYSSAKLRRYQDLIDQHLSKLEPQVFGMLNTKYILVREKETGEIAIRYNTHVLGNAWFVDHIEVADGAKEESDALRRLDLATTAVVDRSFAPMAGDLHPGVHPDAKIKLSAHTPDSRDYDYSSPQDATVVFSEIYYPHGWKATIDGKPAAHFRANYLLRAMQVPAGKHHIRFVFEPDSVRKGDTLALVFITLMYLSLAGAAAFGIVRFVRKRREATE